MRPRSLEEFVGQADLLAAGKPFRRAIEADRLMSVILYGPPGSGKSSLAAVIAETTKAAFLRLSAVDAGVSQVRELIQAARERLGQYGQRTIVFVDEIHRFNKGQQDALLPAVEDGTITLIGATTENPYFEVNRALLSRSTVLRLEPLRPEEIKVILRRALDDPDRGLGQFQVRIDPEALDYLAVQASGDARVALNSLDVAVLTTPAAEDGCRHLTLPVIADSLQRKAIVYDKAGDQHYDVISAFIKSLRGSDPDAAVHWLARMLAAGEDPRFIARRMVILASEDIGLADPRALLVATAVAQAVDYVGLPEARLALTEGAIYLACAPKSNAVIQAIDAAAADLERREIGTVPLHLRDASYRGAGELGHGRDYKYPHNFPGHFVAQQYLPAPLQGTVYYRPSSSGEEREFAHRLNNLRQQKKN